jgi:hypothetical protein
MCLGVTAGKDKIYIGGLYKVIILTTCVCRLLHICIHNLVDPQPVLLLAILKYIMANFNVGKDAKTVNVHLKLSPRAGVKNKSLKQI